MPLFDTYIAWLIRLSKRRSRQGLYEFLNVEFSKIPAGNIVLTVGSGGEINTLLSKYAKSNSFQLVSLDIDAARCPDIVGDVCSYEFAESYYDCVVFCEVLEHLKSPTEGLSNIYRTLKPGGRLIISTPFIFPIHDRPSDYYRFTKYGLSFLLKDFHDVHVLERNSYFEAIDVLWLRLLIERSRRARLTGCLLIPVIYYLFRPLTLLLSRLVPVDSITTGYVAIASKQLTRMEGKSFAGHF